MAKIKRIALFAYPDNLYVNQLMGLKRAFNDLGIDAIVGWPWLEGRHTIQFRGQLSA